MDGKYELDLQDDEDYPITKNTKKILVSLWLSMQYKKENDLNYFLKNELKFKQLKYYEGHFIRNSEKYLDFGDCCGGGTFEKKIILPIIFECKESALNWINEKIKNSRSLSFSDLSDSVCSLVDADVFEKEYNKKYKEQIRIDSEREKILKIIKEQEKLFYQELKLKLNKEFKEKNIIEDLLRNKG